MQYLKKYNLKFIVIFLGIIALVGIILYNFGCFNKNISDKTPNNDIPYQSWVIPDSAYSMGIFKNNGSQFGYYNKDSQKLTIFSTVENKIVWTSTTIPDVIDIRWSSSDTEAFVSYFQNSLNTPGENIPSFVFVNKEGAATFKQPDLTTDVGWWSDQEYYRLRFNDTNKNTVGELIDTKSGQIKSELFSANQYFSKSYLSPDKKYFIATSSNESDQLPHAFLINLENKEIKNLSFSAENILWSPDSKHLIVTNKIETNPTAEIYSINEAKNLHQLEIAGVNTISWLGQDQIIYQKPFQMQNNNSLNTLNIIDNKEKIYSLPQISLSLDNLQAFEKKIFYTSENQIFELSL